MDTLKRNLENICASIMAFYSELIQKCVSPFNPATKSHPEYKSNCFQVFGFDILFDKKGKAWLLEINDHPSMDTIACKMTMGCNHKNCKVSEVDMYVKKKVQYDTIQLGLRMAKKGTGEVLETYRSLTKIMPFSDSVHSQMSEHFSRILNLFMTISNGRMEMKSHEFEKYFYSNAYISKNCAF